MSPSSSPQTPPRNSQLATRNSVLFLTHRFPYPPNRGDRIRSYNLLRVLADKYSVTLGCTTDEPIGDSDRQHVEAICEDLLIAPLVRPVRLARGIAAMLAGKSLTEGMFSAPSLASRVKSWQQDKPFDAVVVFCSSMFPYVDHAAFASTPRIVDLVDVDSEKWRQMGSESAFPKSWIYTREARCVRSLEQRIANQASAVTLVSDAEADVYKRTVTASCPVVGVSNGVDTDYFRPSDDTTPPPIDTSSDTSSDTPSDRSPIRLVFTGVLDYSPNVEGIIWFCRNVLPQLRQESDVQLQIVGRRPCKRVLELNELAGVEVVGEVPDVRPYLHAADIAIAPLKLARGIQNKVLEAMAAGLPVVLTAQAAEGISATSGAEFLIADSVQQWTRAIAQLAGNRTERLRFGAAARQLALDGYSWPARLSKMDAIVSRLVSEASPDNG